MRNMRHWTGNESRRGSALVIVTFIVVAMAGLSLSLLAITDSTNKSQREARERASAMYVAEAGISQAIFDLQTGGTGVMGTEQAPVAYEQSELWVDVTDLGGGQRSILSTGTDQGVSYRVEVVVEQVVDTTFIWAAFGDLGMTMDSNAFVDSYDSSLGLYETQDINGSGSDKYANEKGNIGSNNDVGMDSNTVVHGDAQPGPSGTTTLTGKASVTGSTAPAAQTIPLPPLVIPSAPPSGSVVVSGSSTQTLGSGTYAFTEFTLQSNSKLFLTGPATIVVTDMTLGSNAELIVDATLGPVEFFVEDDFVMNSNTLITSTTFTPSDVAINLQSDNVVDPETEVDLDVVDFDSNAQLYGTIYAPNASVTINSNFELFGSIVAYQVHLDSNSRVHYDEALASGGANADSTYQMAMWRGAPYHPGMSATWSKGTGGQSGY